MQTSVARRSPAVAARFFSNGPPGQQRRGFDTSAHDISTGFFKVDGDKPDVGCSGPGANLMQTLRSERAQVLDDFFVQDDK